MFWLIQLLLVASNEANSERCQKPLLGCGSLSTLYACASPLFPACEWSCPLSSSCSSLYNDVFYPEHGTPNQNQRCLKTGACCGENSQCKLTNHPTNTDSPTAGPSSPPQTAAPVICPPYCLSKTKAGCEVAGCCKWSPPNASYQQGGRCSSVNEVTSPPVTKPCKPCPSGISLALCLQQDPNCCEWYPPDLSYADGGRCTAAQRSDTTSTPTLQSCVKLTEFQCSGLPYCVWTSKKCRWK